MKVLFISLARIGDIYQSWPSLRAFHRLNPQAEIHILTRKKFHSAFTGIDFPITFHLLPTEGIIEDYFANNDAEKCLQLTQQFIAKLKSQKYDQVINLTFSPLSASISALVSDFSSKSKTLGFSRNLDLSLKIADEWSAYFYAQVGIGKWNRIHMLEFYANFLQVELIDEDYNYKSQDDTPYQFQSYIAIHIGASQANKNFSFAEWNQFLTRLLNEVPHNLVILGSEKDIIPYIPENPRLRQLIGETNLDDVFQIIKNSELFIGPDSSLLQMANLLRKKSLNISFETVRFWESGPKAKNSYVVIKDQFQDLEEIVTEIKKSILGLIPGLETFSIDPETGAYHGVTSSEEDEAWSLICSIYFQLPLYSPLSNSTLLAIRQIDQANQMALDFLSQIKSSKDLDSMKHLLDATDAAFIKIKRLVPQVSPIVDWLLAERVQILPYDVNTQLEQLVSETYKKHQQLKNYLIKYEIVQTKEVQDENSLLASRNQE